MSAFDLVVAAERAVTLDGVVAAEVGVRDGVIQAVVPLGTGLDGHERRELGSDETLLPGLVDSHVHVNEPGRSEWEGFVSATRAAAAGGVTTIVDMPLNSIPPTVSVEALRVKRDAARGRVFVDVGFWGGAIPGNSADLRPLDDAGVLGFKCFLIKSGVPEFPPVSEAGLNEALRQLGTLDALLAVHAEDEAVIAGSPRPHGPSYAKFLASRPAEAERRAVEMTIDGARATGARVHILHLSAAEAVASVAEAKRQGLPVTGETCPHYLALTSEDVPDGGTAFKCCPPIRDASNRELLWQALTSGVIDTVVSDHSPATVELKLPPDQGFDTAWGGIASLQLSLSLVWSEASSRGIGIERVAAWMSTNTASLMGLRRKGAIAPGRDADLVVFAPYERFVVDAAMLEHRNPVSPYQGRELIGGVRATFLRGRLVDGAHPHGVLIPR